MPNVSFNLAGKINCSVSAFSNIRQGEDNALNVNNRNLDLTNLLRTTCKNKTNLAMTDYEVICSYSRCKDNLKYKLYRKAMHNAGSYLNYEYIVKKMREIEYLKFLLLNAHQIKSFDFFKKVKLTGEDLETALLDTQLSNLDPHQDLIQVQGYLKNAVLSDIDKKIVKLLS